MASVVNLPSHKDPRGSLTVIDKILPFSIQRVYYIYGCNDQPRGGHRHHKTIQGLVCVQGACTVDWTNGKAEGSTRLDSPDSLLIVQPEDWHVMKNFTADAVLLVLASHSYDADDYIDEAY